MIGVRLSSDIEKRLDALAKATGRTKTYYVREAILERIRLFAAPVSHVPAGPGESRANQDRCACS